MAWDDNLLVDQRNAAGHIGSHARLLAGPGTGKTRSLTRRICFLIEERGIDSSAISALTFTRAAAHELRQRVEAEVGADKLPKISTLHSFALRQLLRNADRLTTLPQPLRIADDWEERHIILEDLKALLQLARIDDARQLLNELSADWQRLTADMDDWDRRFPNPAFLGAWREHKAVYGYVLRAELVYQLKRALEQHMDFAIEGPPRHLLVDEYQDLNRCDLAIIRAIADKGTEVYAAGDDDQSIYGFRMAHPEGIRRFVDDFAGARPLALEICKRCDQEILDIGLFVARQDFRRIEKPLRADEGRVGGEVAILRFLDQEHEAQGIAGLCRYLVDHFHLEPDQILILLRADHNGAFSAVLRQGLEARDIPVGVATADTDPLNQDDGRQILAYLRLLANENDNLAWRTLLKLRRNNLGEGAVDAVYQVARLRNTGFAGALQAICDDPSLGGRHGRRIKLESETIRMFIERLCPTPADDEETGTSLSETVERVVAEIAPDNQRAQAILRQLELTINVSEPHSINDLVRALEVSREDIEQEIEQGKVNILTMHKAKGLTAEAVIVAAAEDEYIPGRAVAEAIDDERRLLYVSLTRPMHHLFITYCTSRTGGQRHSGRTSGQIRRSLTQFLQDAPIAPQEGMTYVLNLTVE